MSIVQVIELINPFIVQVIELINPLEFRIQRMYDVAINQT